LHWNCERGRDQRGGGIMKRCLYCYEPLHDKELDFHASCSKKIFGLSSPPVVPFSEEDFETLATELIQNQTAITGVQTKLSLHITSNNTVEPVKRFTIVGLWGGYIIKLPTLQYPQLPEVEDLTMHLAKLTNIKTVPHTLIRLSSGNLAYITKRVDRVKKGKLAMEDMCQLTERLTEDKYRGSYEQIAKAIQKYSTTSGLDVVNLFEVVLFSFLTGNADMHLKNFSLLEHPGLGMILAPAYDLVNTKLVNPADDEELALNLNGKKRRLKKQDFVAAMNSVNLDPKQQDNIFNKMEKAKPTWFEFIDHSFLSDDFKEMYKSIITERFEKLKG
jgi:serine/threonine-protein kinase HipA